MPTGRYTVVVMDEGSGEAGDDVGDYELSASCNPVIGSCPNDIDGDGVSNYEDNFLIVPNPEQRDTDEDGYGNLCDGDFNQDCTVNTLDLEAMRAVFFQSDPNIDMNGDGVVNFVDFGLMKEGIFLSPGPAHPGHCN